MKRIDTITKGWQQYTLLDSGEGRKLEQFGSVLLDRPDPQALWKKTQLTLWTRAGAHFAWTTSGEKWKVAKGTPEVWGLSCEGLRFSLALGKFKHIGIFPEHYEQWKEIAAVCRGHKGVRVLNLFGYTGAASLAAAAEGAAVTHVDASKQTIGTVKENITLSGLPANAIRLVCEDALKYTKRLVQRDEQFEVIVMDPPAFGRGPKGEVWKIEEKLAELLTLIPSLLSDNARLVILNGYAAGYSARSFGELLADALKGKGGDIVYGDVGIAEQGSSRVLSTGIYATWSR